MTLQGLSKIGDRIFGPAQRRILEGQIGEEDAERALIGKRSQEIQRLKIMGAGLVGLACFGLDVAEVD